MNPARLCFTRTMPGILNKSLRGFYRSSSREIRIYFFGAGSVHGSRSFFVCGSWSVHGQFHGQQLSQIRHICAADGTNVIICGTPRSRINSGKNGKARYLLTFPIYAGGGARTLPPVHCFTGLFGGHGQFHGQRSTRSASGRGRRAFPVPASRPRSTSVCNAVS